MSHLAPFVLAFSAVMMAAYGGLWCWRPAEGAGWVRSGVKTGAVLGLGIWGAAMGAPALALLGVMFGAAGDWFLSRPGPRAFLAGMAAFGVGHLAYLGLFLGAAQQGPQTLYAALGLVGLALSTEFWLIPRTGALKGPVRAYVGVICAMAWAATSLPAGFGVLQVGAALFVLSDVLLAVQRFVVGEGGKVAVALSLVLWPTYWLGQALILAGSLGL